MAKSDFPALRTLGGNPEVMRYITGKAETEEATRNSLAKSIKFNQEHPDMGYFICHTLEDKRFVASVCLRFLDNTPEYELGYRIHPDFWRQGFGTEIAHRILRHAFETLKLEKVAAITEEANIGSARIMEKCGMRFEKTVRYYGAAEDLLYYVVRRRDFSK